jgi:hypothetical protein
VKCAKHKEQIMAKTEMKTRDRIDVDELRSPAYEKNSRRGGSDYPCVSCGASIKPSARMHYIHLCDGGSAIRLPLEGTCDNAAGCLACYPIGEGCWRRLLKKIPDLARFEQKMEE